MGSIEMINIIEEMILRIIKGIKSFLRDSKGSQDNNLLFSLIFPFFLKKKWQNRESPIHLTSKVEGKLHEPKKMEEEVN